MIKKCFSIVSFLLIVTFGLSACSTQASVEPTKEATSPTIEAAAPTIENSTPTAKPILKVGLITALSGSASLYGLDIQKGTQLAIDEINAAGGVGGYTLELIAEDHAVDPDKAVSAVQKLISIDKVSVVFSSFSGPTLAIQPITYEQRLLVINAASAGPSLLNKPGLYNSVPNFANVFPKLMKWILAKTNAKSIATVYWNDDAGTNVNKMVNDACQQYGCTVVIAEPEKVGETDFRTTVSRIKAAKPDLIILGEWGDDFGYVMKEIRAQGITTQIIGADWNANALEIAGKQAMEGYLAFKDYLDNNNPGDPEAATFIENYQKAYGELPKTNFSGNFWEATKFILVPLIQEAVNEGKDPTQQGVLLSMMEKFVADGTKMQTIFGESMIMNADGSIDKPFNVWKVTDGNLAFYDKP
jgi:branched-chain amino acid transport system substrate-binding protein